MSRLAQKPILVPQGVSIVNEGGLWIFRGPRGEVKRLFPPSISIEQKENMLILSLAERAKKSKAILGTSAAHIKNAIEGVTRGFEKKLEIEGVGYKAQLEGNILALSLGFTHPVKIQAPADVQLKVEKNVITITGANKDQVGKIAAEIRKIKPPEPYKGKGIRYSGEVIRRKAGKKAVSTA